MDYDDYYLNITNDSKVVARYNGDYVEDSFHLSDDDRSFINATTKDLENPNYVKDGKKGLVEDVGRRLANVLFTSEIKKDFYKRKGEAENQKKGLRIRLKIETPDLINYPWESLYLDGKYIAISVSTPLTRFIDDIRISNKEFNKPLKILIVASTPTAYDLPAVTVDNEIEAIRDSLRKEIDNKFVTLTIERHATSRKIINHLNEDCFNIVHFIGHGMFDENKGVGSLVLVKDNTNEPDFADHKRVGMIFQNSTSFEKSIAIVVLNTCQGAQLGSSKQIGSSKAFTGLASELVKMGFPTIVAMRHSITNQAANYFSKEFYFNLLGRPIDEKLQMIRQKLIVDSELDPFDFTAPVLFMSAESGKMLKSKDEVTSHPDLKYVIEELKKNYKSFIIQKIDSDDLWLLIWHFYKNYGDVVDTRVMNVLQNTVINVPNLIKHCNEDRLSGLNDRVIQHENTIRLNFDNLFNELKRYS